MASQDLVREVFGGSDSELSDEEEVSKKIIPSAKPRDDYESSGADSGDEYVQERRHPSVVGKARKIKRKRTLDADGQPRKRKKRVPVEPDLSELTPEQAARRRTDMQIDEILKSKKTVRRKKKTNEEVLDSFADHEVSRLREVMNAAAEEDINANHEKTPALAKLKLLPEAMETLRKQAIDLLLRLYTYELFSHRASLAQSMIDNNLLDGVRRWLEPLPDRSLPALNIQRELFGVIRKMEFIDSSVLKESGLGRIVLFYTKCSRVNSDIKRIANDLVMAWARPIIKRSASYRDKVVPVAQEGDASHRGGENLNAILARARETEKGRVRKNAVMIPQRELGSYTVAPKSNTGALRNNESRTLSTSFVLTIIPPMHPRRPQPPVPGTLTLPPQSLQNRRSSLLSAASSPRTPCASPKWSPIYFSSAANRNSTDSWNSSNGPDEIEWEWKPEQVLLSTPHLVTPFIGPVPPSNLLDKIARGIAHAKGPLDWPHSVRATRVKLVELAKKRAKDESLQHSDVSDRENQFDAECDAKRQNIRRPLYRQNSMDFMNVAGPHLDEDNITRLANRLQRTDKFTSIYHPYARKSRLQDTTDRPSPSSPGSLNTSTPSSSTLTSFASSRSRFLRRSGSSLSSTSSMSITSGSSGLAPPSHRCGQPSKIPEVDEAPIPPPKDAKLLKPGSKRAASYGALVQGIKKEKEVDSPLRHERRMSTSSCPSSDEEEKSRTERAKKQKTKVPAATGSPEGPPPTTPLTSPVKLLPSTRLSVSGERRKLPMNLQRNPSILGGELPHLLAESPKLQQSQSQPATPPVEPATLPHPPTQTPSKSAQPSPSPHAHLKTLRRVRRLAPGRRISFGSAASPAIGGGNIDHVDIKGNDRTSLGSAFQMC
ncbi:hypothetical protein M378DRAFT_200399 [Amanita muscaria Koide BX008]|uniref:TFIIS N-terminal domain-containing protein n=1 Tax=Amanita muscaria (strain Koide BX008) TaxID=946122 RepID=A0A0C2S7J6_AMAMK|nr:hypothetical protein M378DRAFT_200399 [Amanita muscaria Koide BX008]